MGALKDRKGHIYGNYLVLSLSEERKRGLPSWVCKCLNCGSIQVRCTAEFKVDKVTSHCPECFWQVKYRGYKDIPLGYWNRCKDQAEERSIEFDLHIWEAWDQYEWQDRECAFTGLPIVFSRNPNKVEQTASLDRLDSNLGYTPENIRWVHKHVNVMKKDYDMDYFLSLCKLVKEPSGSVFEDTEWNK